jgi:hypothetical protein
MRTLRRTRPDGADDMPMRMGKSPRAYGMIAEFDGPDALVEATQRTYQAGYRRMDAYTPFPVHGLAEAMGRRGIRLPLLVLAGGILGAVGAFLLQTYANVFDYPMNIGGRPLFSWPAYIPIIFELMVLAAVFAAVFGMLALNGLPQPHHPVFNAPHFELASRTHFFLCVEAADPKYDSAGTRRFLEGLGPTSVAEIEK